MVWIPRRHHPIRPNLPARSQQGDPHSISSWTPCTVINLLTCTGKHCSYPQTAPKSPKCGLPYQNKWVLLGPGQQECTDTVAMAASLQKPCQGHRQPGCYMPPPLACIPWTHPCLLRITIVCLSASRFLLHGHMHPSLKRAPTHILLARYPSDITHHWDKLCTFAISHTTQHACRLQGVEVSDPNTAEGAELHQAAIEAYTRQAAARQAEKELQRQQAPAPPDAAVNFSPAVGELAHCLHA